MTTGWRRLSALSLAAMMIAAACGNQGGGGTSPTTGGGGGTSPSAGGGESPSAGGESPSAGGESPSAGGGGEGEITVRSLWGGAEEEAFQAVVDAFEESSGFTVVYEGVRESYEQVLQTNITGGNPPDVAVIPGIGFLRRFARDGSIKPLSELGIDANALAGNYPEGFWQAGQVDGEQFALPAKYNSKSTMWYRPDQFEELGVEPAEDWEGFKALLDQIREDGTTPLGLGAGGSPSSEWTLTDWFENIYIRQAGVEAYDRLFSTPEGDFTDPTVSAAIAEMTSVLSEENVVGGIDGALATDFVSGIGQVFGEDPQAVIYYEGGFVGAIATGDVNENLEFGETIDWFDFPSFGEGNPVTFGGDVIGALTTDPGVKEFLEYLATPEAGNIWVETGAVISPLSGVDAYPEATQREAEQLSGASDVRFDGSDLLPAGSPNWGALLQSALRGEDVNQLLADFEPQVQTAWDNQ